MRNIIEYLVKISPVAMLLFFLIYSFSSQIIGFDFNYVISGNFIGCSIIANIAWAYIFWCEKGREKDVINRVAVLSLFLTNVLCIIYYKSGGNYSVVYDLLIVSIIFIVKVKMFLKEKNEGNY